MPTKYDLVPELQIHLPDQGSRDVRQTVPVGTVEWDGVDCRDDAPKRGDSVDPYRDSGLRAGAGETGHEQGKRLMRPAR